MKYLSVKKVPYNITQTFFVIWVENEPNCNTTLSQLLEIPIGSFETEMRIYTKAITLPKNRGVYFNTWGYADAAIDYLCRKYPKLFKKYEYPLKDNFEKISETEIQCTVCGHIIDKTTTQAYLTCYCPYCGNGSEW